MVKKRTPSGGSSATGRAEPARCDLAEAYPELWGHLSAERYPDGSARVTGTMLLLFELGLFKAAIMDRDACLTAFVSGHTIRDVLNAAEAGLESDKLEWRPARGRPVPRK
jgi:hypothetical protein